MLALVLFIETHTQRNSHAAAGPCCCVSKTQQQVPVCVSKLTRSSRSLCLPLPHKVPHANTNNTKAHKRTRGTRLVASCGRLRDAAIAFCRPISGAPCMVAISSEGCECRMCFECFLRVCIECAGAGGLLFLRRVCCAGHGSLGAGSSPKIVRGDTWPVFLFPVPSRVIGRRRI